MQPTTAMRVVSLVPSITETLMAWGITPVACTDYCEQPSLRHVGGVKNPMIDEIIALRPDVVAMDRHENRKEDAESLLRAGIDLAVLNVDSLNVLDDNLRLLANKVGAPPPPPSALDRPDIDNGTPSGEVRRVFVPIWRRPWMSIGATTYGSSLLARLGYHNVLSDAAVDYPTVTLDEVATHRPELVIVPSEPYNFKDGHIGELANLAPTIRVDGRDLFWWGARTPTALARLDAVLRGS